MAAPAKTTDGEIIRAARQLLEARGPTFSMADVAAAVGVRAPSLYGRFVDRAALLAAVELEVLQELALAVGAAGTSRDARLALAAHARAYRAFAKANPASYSLLYGPDASPSEAGTQARAAALAVMMPAITALVGERNALLAARTLVPFMHGFVAMEIAGAFRMGPGVDQAFKSGIAAILSGLAQENSKPNPQRKR